MQQVTHEIQAFDYTTPILMLVGLGVVAIFLAFLLKKADKKQGYGLEMPSGAKSPQQLEVENEANAM